MKIEIWSDIMCPFCYIGKRRLESALKDFEFADKIEIEWKSFLLNPEMVTDPNKSTLEYLSETKGWSLGPNPTDYPTSCGYGKRRRTDLPYG
jgi:predicted DsbA family dithiol-disulfide isomerase